MVSLLKLPHGNNSGLLSGFTAAHKKRKTVTLLFTIHVYEKQEKDLQY